jgi:hypothetical protein
MLTPANYDTMPVQSVTVTPDADDSYNNYFSVTNQHTLSCVECITTAGVCGSVDGTTVYDASGNGSALTSASSGLCGVGTVASFTYSNNTWTWECDSTDG